MKKMISIFLLAAVLAFSGCSSQKTSSIDYSGMNLKKFGAMALWYEYIDLADLEESSDLIVIGTFTGDSKSEFELGYSSIMGMNGMSDITSYNTMKISKVIKGDVKAGDEIEVSQLYVVKDDTLHSFSKMTPMIKGDTWLYFLAKSDRNRAQHYDPVGDCQGRYPIPGVTNTVLPYALDNGIYEQGYFREDIYTEILEKYEF